MAEIWVIHGPNLNLLGEREPNVYGSTTLSELDASLAHLGAELGVSVVCRQANGEGAIIDLLHEARVRADGVVINPGGYTHTSVAISDALRGIRIPAIEVHISNLFAREDFRRQSLTGTACLGVVMGLGVESYEHALRHLARRALAGGPRGAAS